MEKNQLPHNDEIGKEEIKCTPLVYQWIVPDSYTTNEAFVQDSIKLASEDSKKEKEVMATPTEQKQQVE